MYKFKLFYFYRERIIYMLALKPLRRPDIVLKLKKGVYNLLKL